MWEIVGTRDFSSFGVRKRGMLKSGLDEVFIFTAVG